MEGRNWTTTLLDASLDDYDALTTCAIRVDITDDSTREEHLEYFFESERRSGGGPIVDFEPDPEGPQSFIITFNDPEG